LRALRWSDVDLGRSEIRVQRSWDYKEGPIEPKSKASIRTVPILAVLRDYLDQHKLSTGRDGSDLVFGRKDSAPFCPPTLRNRALKAWEGMEPIGFHEARHTFASLLIDAGTNPKAIQTFMGHSSISITFDVYGHLMPGSRDEVRECMDAYLASCASNAPVNSPAERFPAVGDETEEAGIPDSQAL
jgi:integrase